MSSDAAAVPRPAEFSHEALFYDGMADFLYQTATFVRAGLAADDAILVVVDAPKLRELRAELGADAGDVWFEDMSEVGRNPARIIPRWRDFLDDHPGRGLRGVGEPIGPRRQGEELVECQRHETLLNVAFAESGPWELLCPYDVGALAPPIIEEARRSHPCVVEDGRLEASPTCRDPSEMTAPFRAALPGAPSGARYLAFDRRSLGAVRALVTEQGLAAGLPEERAADLALSVHEAAANSVRHAAGHGELRIWSDDGAVVAEVRDPGRLDEPLAGRERPELASESGRGIWLANQLCDLVQLRSFDDGNVVRAHMRVA